MPTLDQLKEFLSSMGLSIPPDFILQAWLDMVAVIQPCLDGAGYPASTQLLIYLYLIGLYAIAQGDKYVSSETAPSGASRSYRFKGDGKQFDNVLGLLRALDTSGCTDSLVPSVSENMAGLWISNGGSCC